MLNFRFILKMLGSICVLETVFMLVATAVAAFYGDGDVWAFLISSAVILISGLAAVVFSGKIDEDNVGYREGMIVVTLTWVSLSVFGMLPFYIGGYIPSITDAFFETMSGFTTTGASIFVDVEHLPHGILFWRSLTQWQGGLGVVVFTVALLPILSGGASQMFEAEVTGTGISHERIRPRVTQVAKRLSGIYIVLTAIASVLLWIGPMNGFDAVNHALTTVSTGGYSTRNMSIASWDSAYIEYVIMVFMLVGSINATLLYFLLKGKIKKFFHDAELRSFLRLIVTFSVICIVWMLVRNHGEHFGETVRHVAFEVISIVSSTGFMAADYVPWGSFFALLALILMFIGGCAGSTSGGLKVGRAVIINKHLYNVFLKQIHPNAVRVVRMSDHVVSVDNVYRCLAFAFIYIGLIIAGCLLLTFDGATLDSAIGSSLAAISNVGPGLGEYGPAGNYASLPDMSKWTLSFLMLAGRLELFTVIILLLPDFWKK
jgi:trk system potassium uptake protein TrkH